MHILDAAAVRNNLQWTDTVEALRRMFAEGCEAPVRHHHPLAVPGEAEEATLLLMPAWVPGRYLGLKMIGVYPGNAGKGLPTIQGSYLLMEGSTGTPLAVLDAGELTARRTVAASALAADYLSREDASRLLIVGSGRLAAYLGFAHSCCRPIREIRVWARNPAKARVIVAGYQEAGYAASLAENLAEAAAWADIISCVTPSTSPLILGRWLRPGVHVDLIGGFKPTMREADDEVIGQATVFVDTREGVLAEAGDLLQPMAAGLFTPDDIAAELSELAAKRHPGRTSPDEVTLFKSVGASLEDLAAAICCYQNALPAAGW